MAKQQAEDAATASKQYQEDMRNVEKVGMTTRRPENTFEEVLNAIVDSLSNSTCSENEEDWELEEDNTEDTEPGKLSKDDEPS